MEPSRVARGACSELDTDVAVSFANNEGLWVVFGTGKSFRYLDAQRLGDDKGNALPAFHALNGGDTTSCFAGRGKCTAWSSWNAFRDVTPALYTLTQTPIAASIDEVFPVMEKFVVVMYDRGSSEDHLNQAEQVLFTHKGREIENIPPT